MKITRHMREGLKDIARVSEYEPVRSPYMRGNESLVRRGLLEYLGWRMYQPPPRLEPHYRLTALGRATLRQNEPEE